MLLCTVLSSHGVEFNLLLDRYREGHAIKHWKETQHCYSLELETQRVWDYVGDNYVHRLIQSKTDGKLVEFDCVHVADTCEICEGGVDSGVSEALFNSKIEAVRILTQFSSLDLKVN